VFGIMLAQPCVRGPTNGFSGRGNIALLEQALFLPYDLWEMHYLYSNRILLPVFTSGLYSC
jgi:hypothetical protein